MIALLKAIKPNVTGSSTEGNDKSGGDKSEGDEEGDEDEGAEAVEIGKLPSPVIFWS